MQSVATGTSFTNSVSFAIASKVKDYFQLIKFTLSFTVVFSCVVCYLLAPNIQFDIFSVLLLFIGGMLIAGSANAINQTIERDTDALMKRTANRPVAAGRMTWAATPAGSWGGSRARRFAARGSWRGSASHSCSSG